MRPPELDNLKLDHCWISSGDSKVACAGLPGAAQPATSEDPALAKGTYELGDRVWYLMRDGSREAAKVDSVDRTVQPPSYGVVLSKIGSVRETEAIRLRAMTAAEEAAAEAELAKLPVPTDEGEHLFSGPP